MISASVATGAWMMNSHSFVKTQVASGALNVHGAYFGVAEGSLFVLDQATKEFRSARQGE